TPTPSTGGSTPTSGVPFGPIGLPAGGALVGPIALDPSPPINPVGGPAISLSPSTSQSLGTILGVSPSLSLVSLANNPVGGEYGSDGSGIDPNDPAEYAAAIAQSFVTTGVIVATITPSWLWSDVQGEAPPTSQASVALPAAESEPVTVKAAASSVRL